MPKQMQELNCYIMTVQCLSVLSSVQAWENSSHSRTAPQTSESDNTRTSMPYPSKVAYGTQIESLAWPYYQQIFAVFVLVHAFPTSLLFTSYLCPEVT